MDDCKIHHSLWSKIKKLLPTLILIAIITVASLTPALSGAMPYLLKTLMVILGINLGWLMYHPSECAISKLLKHSGMGPQLQALLHRAFCIGYWLCIIVLALSTVAPDLMSKLLMGFGVMTLGTTFALSGLLNDAVCGELLRASERVKEGQFAKIADVTIAEGKVTELGVFRIVIENEALGPVSVPNSKVWASAIATKKPRLMKP